MAKMFTTPTDIPEGVACRTLKIPNDGIWLGIFNAALLETVNPYNWEQIYETDMTIEDTIVVCQAAIEEYWATEGCLTGCSLPEIDTPPFRLGEDGKFQMLDPVTGLWGTPSGEYEIPPTPPREELTADDRKCAAAANAASVMEQLYEAITDEIALGGDTLQVAAALVAALVTAVGGWIAAPVYAIIQLSIALFAGMIELLQALGADVWTEEFDTKLKCALLACATDSGDITDVVTFDLTCIREQLTVVPDIFNPTIFYELQLFAQVVFLMETITMDGLNAAGATTGITEPNCDDCGECGDCSIETATTTSFVWADAFPQGGWTATPTDYYDATLIYIRLETNGGNLFTASEEKCVVQLGASGINRFPGYPSLQLYALIEGVEYAFDGSNNVVLSSPVVTDEVLIYIKDGANGYMSATGFSISWCEHGE